MSFQTFTLFNFFQQPNTGKHKILDKNESEIATTPILNNKGAVADFNWFFPYAGKVIPNAIILGGTPFTLFSDAFEVSQKLEDSIFGIRHPEVKINLYGDFFKDINKSSLNISFSGNFFPKVSDKENLQVYISGLITGEPLDIYSSKINLSGDILKSKHDYNYINVEITGDFSKIFFDFYNIKTFISGIITGEKVVFSEIENHISGNYIPLYKDSSDLEYFLINFSTGKGFKYIDEIFEDEINNLTYSLDIYSKSNN